MTHDFDSSGEVDSDSHGSVPPGTQPVRASRSWWDLPIAGVVLVIVAVVFAVLVHVVPGNSTPSRQATGTSTATPSPRILYTADWSHGSDGWTLPSHWRLANGHIENDGYGTDSLLIPYQVTVPNYSIAVDFTVEKITNLATSHGYGIEGFSTGNTLQFLSSIASITKLPQGPAYHGFSQNYVAHADSEGDQMSTNDFTVLFYTQTFSVQVQGNSVGFCPGVSCLANVNSTTPLSPLQIAIYDLGVQLSISRIVITSP
jgi:hypothetical protein